MHSPANPPDNINATPEAAFPTSPNSAARKVNSNSTHTSTPDNTACTATQHPAHATPREGTGPRISGPDTAPPHAAEAAHTARESTEHVHIHTASKQPVTSNALPNQPSTTAPNNRTAPRSPRRRSNRWLHYAAANGERGMSTAEYAVGTIAACAFAALLFKVVSSPEVQEMLSSLIDRALKTNG
ncbi:DUF4244 domain-containing protein [Nonomuraea basaltis]|uniref:DUF4244 domain-containing protein n=1 Tax=Nonomuraea basaltis TaxID=2495887 RepID=UPI0023F5596D|nr:DUF4244 domain-containing protein [Nonomuraea basaltis]